MKKLFILFVLSSPLSAKSLSTGDQFSIMSYNVENLFDDQDDSDRADETYMPIERKQSASHRDKCKRLANFKYKKDCYRLDWNENTIAYKMKNLADIILSVDNGRGPDILILAEVENLNILKRFNNKFLTLANYKTVELIEGMDPRGIDVAVLSRFPLVEKSQLISLNLQNPRTGKILKTRGLLQVPLRISEKQTLSVYGVHLPSQGSPTAIRRQAVNELNKILTSEKNLWVVGGDFNISQKEENEFQLVSKGLAQRGVVSHLVGCHLCAGTHKYKNKWSFLDLLYFDSRFKKKGLQLINESIKVVNIPTLIGNSIKLTTSPVRFDPAKGQGASDHFPIYARLRLKSINRK